MVDVLRGLIEPMIALLFIHTAFHKPTRLSEESFLRKEKELIRFPVTYMDGQSHHSQKG
jgi:hypothetical protein